MMPVMNERALVGLVARMRAARTDTGRCEVKACAGGLTRDIGRTLAGFANGCGGMLILGLDEKAGFTPAPGFNASAIQDALARVCCEELTPALHPMMDVVLFEGSPVLVVTVDELRPRDKPCFVTRQGRYSGSYIRTGDGDRRLSAYEVDRLFEEREQPRHDCRIVEEAALSDLDEQVLSGVIARERSLHPRYFAQLDRDETLIKLGIAARDAAGDLRPTLGGLVALGLYPQEFYPALTIAFTSYYTSVRDEPAPDGRRFVDARTCVGGAAAMIEEAISAVVRNMRTGARIDGLYRRDVPDYPLDAVREALVNAVMHRDYSPEALGSSIHVDLFPDRMEIVNPGGLFGTVTIDALGGEVPGSRRNSRLAAILESTPQETGGYLAENQGSGFRAMRRAFAEAGLPEPLPRNSISRFSLTLYGPDGVRPGDGLFRDAERSEPNPARPSGRGVVRMSGTYHLPTLMNALERDILEVVKREGEAGTVELVRETGRSRPTIMKALKNLVAGGWLAPTSSVKNNPHLRYRAL